MANIRRRHPKNYDLFASYAYFTPGTSGIVALVLWFLLGNLLGSVVTTVFTIVAGPEIAMEYSMLIAYPVAFIPPMIYAMNRSRNNSLFEQGFELDSNHFGKSAVLTAIIVMVVTVAGSFLGDFVSTLLPPIPESLKTVLESLTEGKIWSSFICVSIYAPLFEEWLCRGMILRGLLNYEKEDGTRGTTPARAIIISALIFALIHLNPWQALPAFLLGCLFGYVYYRTGSLKLTMLMHFTNNTFALIMGHIDSLGDIESWTDVLSPLACVAVAAVCLLAIWAGWKYFSGIRLESERGNCDLVGGNLL